MKRWYFSKTIWLNLLTWAVTSATALASVLGDANLIATYPRAAAFLTGLIAVLNIALRFITSVPIG